MAHLTSLVPVDGFAGALASPPSLTEEWKLLEAAVPESLDAKQQLRYKASF